MGVMQRLTEEIDRRENAGVAVREIELSPRLWYQLLADLGPWVREFFPDVGEGRGTFLGIPVRKGRGSWACRSCGANREESQRCSYCLQPYDRITIDEDILQ